MKGGGGWRKETGKRRGRRERAGMEVVIGEEGYGKRYVCVPVI